MDITLAYLDDTYELLYDDEYETYIMNSKNEFNTQNVVNKLIKTQSNWNDVSLLHNIRFEGSNDLYNSYKMYMNMTYTCRIICPIYNTQYTRYTSFIFYKNGQRHRDGIPIYDSHVIGSHVIGASASASAESPIYGTSTISINGNLNDGILDLPAKIAYFDNGQVYCEDYYKNGQIHRNYGPIYCSHVIGSHVIGSHVIGASASASTGSINGNLIIGIRDLPAKIEYYYNGQVEHETYYKNGQMYRDCGLPVLIEYDKNRQNRQIRYEFYYKNEQRW